MLVGSRLGRPDCLWLQETTMVGGRPFLVGGHQVGCGGHHGGGHRGGGRLLERAPW